jgi:broad specificity phosphatase PhoE
VRATRALGPPSVLGMATRPESKDVTKQIVCKPGIMEAPTMNDWNDNRLNEFSRRTDETFSEVKAEMREGFAQVDQRFEKVDQRFDKVDEEFKEVRQEMKAGFTRVDDQLLRLSHILIVGIAGLIAALVGVIASILLAVIFG